MLATKLFATIQNNSNGLRQNMKNANTRILLIDSNARSLKDISGDTFKLQTKRIVAAVGSLSRSNNDKAVATLMGWLATSNLKTTWLVAETSHLADYLTRALNNFDAALLQLLKPVEIKHAPELVIALLKQVGWQCGDEIKGLTMCWRPTDADVGYTTLTLLRLRDNLIVVDNAGGVAYFKITSNRSVRMRAVASSAEVFAISSDTTSMVQTDSTRSLCLAMGFLAKLAMKRDIVDRLPEARKLKVSGNGAHAMTSESGAFTGPKRAHIRRGYIRVNADGSETVIAATVVGGKALTLLDPMRAMLPATGNVVAGLE